MTGAEWLGCNDPNAMLEFLRGKTSTRKLRLFAVACCYPLLEKVRIPEFPLAKMVETAERFADDLIPASDFLNTFPEGEERYALFVNTPEFNTLNALGQRTCQAVVRLGWSPTEEPKLEQVFTQNETMPQLVRGSWLLGEYPLNRTLLAIGVAAQAWALFKSGCPYPDHPDTYGPWNERAGVPESYFRSEKERYVWFTALVHDIFSNPFRPVAVESSWFTPSVVNLAQSIYDNRTFDRLPLLADALEEAGCRDAEILGHCRGPGPHVRGCWVVDLILGKQ